jgi:coenzyme PQQ synthesis protein D (PqqD)
MKVQPLARQSSLIVKEIENETLVYDLESDKAHCLNVTAARVWKSCDGRTTVSEIAEQLGSNLDQPVDESVVWLALDQLEKLKLLEKAPVAPARLSGMSRRQAVRALGVAAIVLPMVTSLVVPAAAQQGSPKPDDSCCNNPSDCQSNCCAHRPNQPICPSPNKVCVGLTPSQSGPVCQDL